WLWLPNTPKCLIWWVLLGGTSAANFSSSSSGDSKIAVVPSFHGCLRVYSSSPGWELLSLSLEPATGGLAMYLTNIFNLWRWCLPTWVAAWREKPWMVAHLGPLIIGDS